MYDLQRKDPETWNFILDGDLSVNKSLVSFCSIEDNQALGQENKNMKIEGRMKGTGNNKSALEKQFLISCEMSQIAEAFLKSSYLNSDKINREDNYQFTWEINNTIQAMFKN